MDKDIVLMEKNEHIVTLIINRPKALNALNRDVFRRLLALMGELEKMTEVRVVIIKGGGDKAFVCGGDIKDMLNLDVLGGQEFGGYGGIITKKMNEMSDKIFIAAINGYALGGGLELALGCDLRVCTEKSKMGLPEVTIGVVPGNGGTQRLPRTVGKAVAMEMMVTGNAVSAERAERIGLVNAVVPEGQLMPVCEALATKIIANSPMAVTACKELLTKGIEMTLEQGILMESFAFGRCFATQDQKEGMAAFVEKRQANY